MKPLTIDSFKCGKIRAVSSDLKSVDDFNTLWCALNTMEKMCLHLESTIL